MSKLVLKHENGEFQFHFGSHRKVPAGGEALKAGEIDALVLEGIEESDARHSSQVEAIYSEMKRLGKPVYFIESPKLVHEVWALEKREDVYNSVGRWTNRIITGVSVALLGTGAGIAVMDKEGRRTKLSRRLLLASIGGGLARFGLGFVFPLDLTRVRTQAENRIDEPREYTLQEILARPADDPKSISIAVRNAVIAEGLLTLARRHKNIGVVAGAAHYNIPRYLLEEKLRKKTKGKYSPNIIEI